MDVSMRSKVLYVVWMVGRVCVRVRVCARLCWSVHTHCLQPMVKVVARVQASSPLLIKKVSGSASRTLTQTRTRILSHAQIAAETNRIIAEENARIISFAQGVPNLPIFEAARDRMLALLDGRRFPYTDVPGNTAVRDTCAKFVNWFYPMPKLNGLDASDYRAKPFQYEGKHITVTAGAIQVLPRWSCFRSTVFFFSNFVFRV